jgi:hypothetical protein
MPRPVRRPRKRLPLVLQLWCIAVGMAVVLIAELAFRY